MSVTMEFPVQNTDQQRVANLCSSWLLRQRSSSLLPAPGTTFPPLKQHLPYFKERLENFAAAQARGAISESRSPCKCLSEPDLSMELEPGADPGEDDDFLFEFDIGSPADSQDDDLGSEIDQTKIVNVVEDYNYTVGTDILEGRRCSGSSETCSNCSSSHTTLERVNSRDGLSTMFGSISSGLGSDGRSSGDTLMEGEERLLEGLSVGPEGWLENCALYLGSSGISRGSEGSGTATPILAVSPGVQDSSPLVSPDSCLEEEIEPVRLCVECQEEIVEPEENLIEDMEESVEDESTSVEDSTSSDMEQDSLEKDILDSESDELEPISEDIESEEVKSVVITEERVEIKPDLVVSTDKLASLLGHLQGDKHYPNEDELTRSQSSSSLLSPPSREVEGDVEDNRPKLRKCSSLKTGRTPPATPGVRKIVRFADIFGLDLSEVKIFSDEIPKIPRKAYEDLDVDPSEFGNFPGSPKPQQRSISAHIPKVTSTSLVPMFNQPGSSPHFFEQILNRKVVLESAFMDGSDVVSGLVRVVNLSFHKTVTIRWTTTDWNLVEEVPAEYVVGSSSNGTDTFSFRMVTNSLQVGSRLQFCIKFSTSGTDFWDSNGGSNYLFQVFPSSSGQSSMRTSPLDITRGPMVTSSLPPARSFSFAGTHSPSQHGDDPWLRFM